MQSDPRIERAYWALRTTMGGTAFAAGLDKFFNLLTDWDKYLDRKISRKVGLSPRNFMRLVGVIEMAAGAAILKGNTRLGGYLTGAWLLGIAGNLISRRDYYDIAARDVNMAVGAFVLAHLSELRTGARLGQVSVDIGKAA